ncbi:post-GPI attachment to proteins factor 2-like [Panonychus citri]|uniref:post-GPI attachment to proteins factor 2-like n=1 Tax=Panonychus citri TaxID=50023 RepID=UPI002307ABB8|nr:post-GPI attachment to proteins factor 2-like [Panonychus citri]XP_053214845.1 post-GPI attachment to proteins factor 2-like [Panonychus citri]
MKSTKNLKPLVYYKDNKCFLFSFTHLAVITTALPLGSFIFCVLWSLYFNFKESTSTHCRVSNYLPSISASVGSYSPQKYVWRICIAIHSGPRYLVTYMYYLLVHGSFQTLLLNLIEITSLIGLTYIGSTENHVYHAFCFTIFIISGSLGMTLVTNSTYKSRRIKSFLKYTNLISIGLAIVLYYRHNWFCEPGVYTLFALAEYVVVLTNIAFHFQAYYDFQHHDLLLVNRLTSNGDLTIN